MSALLLVCPRCASSRTAIVFRAADSGFSARCSSCGLESGPAQSAEVAATLWGAIAPMYQLGAVVGGGYASLRIGGVVCGASLDRLIDFGDDYYPDPEATRLCSCGAEQLSPHLRKLRGLQGFAQHEDGSAHLMALFDCVDPACGSTLAMWVLARKEEA